VKPVYSITKPKEKNVGERGILYPHYLKKWGGRVPRVPHLIASMAMTTCLNLFRLGLQFLVRCLEWVSCWWPVQIFEIGRKTKTYWKPEEY